MNSPSPDHLFAEYLRRGEPERFAELYDLLRPELTTAAERLAPNRTAADDLVQATFLGALESAGRFQRGRKVVPWLIGILKNQARMMRWQAARKPDPQRLAWPEPSDPVDLAADREFAQVVERAFEQLGPTYAPVMQLHLRDEMSAQDIGRALQRPAGTVRTQVVRGTALLRGLLPAGVASLLLVRVTPALDVAGVREVLLEHAARGRIATTTWLSARAILLAAASMVTIAIAWLTLSGSSGNDAAPPDALRQEARTGERLAEAPSVVQAAADASTAVERLLVTPPSTGRLTVTVASRGEPVPAMPVQLIGLEDPRFRRASAMTDAAGVATLADLPAGRWLVAPVGERAPRTAGLVELRDGQQRELRVEIDQVLSLEGRVVDDRGAPIAFAQVWVCDGDYVHSFGFGAWPMLTTGDDGRFTLMTCARHNLQTVQVTAPGYRASTLERLPRQQSTQHTFTLARDGGAVQGTVVDATGSPIGGVLVRAAHAGERSNLAFVTADGTTTHATSLGAIREVTTGADGRFCIEGFDHGAPVALKVWGPDWARSDRTVAAGEGPVAVTMQRGAVIHGRIVDAAGKPVAEAMVAAEPELDHDPMTARVSSDADGRYTLAGVTPGDAVAVTATSRPDPRGHGGDGDAKTTLRLEPGRRHEWNAQLAAGDAFRGTLTRSDGEPFDGWTFDLQAIDKVEGRNHFPVQLGKRGEFEVKSVPRSRYWLNLSYGDCTFLQYVVSWPLADHYDIVVPAHIARRTIEQCKDAVAAPQQPATGTVDVLGTQAGLANVGTYLFAVGGDQPWQWIGRGLAWNAERSCETAALAPGQYELTVFSTQWSSDALATADQVIPFTITANQTTTLRVSLQPGVRRCFRIDEPSPHLGAYRGFGEVRDANGRLVSRWVLPRWLEPTPGTFDASVALAPGRYRLEVETDLGHRGALDFTVDSLHPFPDVMPLPVR